MRIWIQGYLYPEEFNINKYCRYNTGLQYKSRIDYLNYIFYMDGQHKHMFEGESLTALLMDVGFKKVRIRDFDPGLDKLERKNTSIYLEAMK